MKFKYGIGSGKPDTPTTHRWVVYEGAARPCDVQRAASLRRMLGVEEDATEMPDKAEDR